MARAFDFVATAAPGVVLTDHDPDAEVKVVAAALYSVSHLSDATLLERARAMTTAERAEVLRDRRL